ncbi:tRNA-dihydrouridine synthase [Sulfurovum sp. zt1-1]|uniref:tRNA-dihydrouridine synthase n=1 Tax=Sulfurovum zhangzhouensis TaxID=3019067 RepID=A0ABT7QYF8_9BACT|nr:tRNA-dihydrouridine synthase [Sulfurovum zhangzhouensis]MDM5271865.1 tRNA-dihydrouridine synthase [Sulfurovum zhangzhouensis]
MATIDFSKTLYALAPLAGFTDLPFRSVVKKFGVDLTVSEMISSNALVHQSKKTYRMVEKSPLEDLYSIQLAGSDQEVMRKAVEYVNTLDDVSVIDLNCGCPAPKIVNNLQGSSLLTDLDKMGETIRTIKKHSLKPYTSVKIRIGFNEKNPIEIAKICEDNGADFIAVHGRTRAGRYKAPVDYDAIRDIKKAVSIPVIANGDIDSPEKAKWVLEHTGADGIMIGRAAVGRPWIFHQIKEGMEEVSPALIKAVVLEHFDQMIEHYENYGAIMFRKNLHSYSKAGFQGASAFRNLVNRMEDPKEMREVIEEFFSQDYISRPH